MSAHSDGHAGHFDARASTWDDDPAKVERSRRTADLIATHLAWPDAPRVLEYGAGTGLVSQALSGRIASLTLVDSSTGMRAVLAEKQAAGVFPADTTIVDQDFATHPGGTPGGYDIVLCSMVLHHIPDVARVLERFAAVLPDGGVACIVDFDEEDGSFHDHLHDFDGHHGFDRGHLAGLLRQAGFATVEFHDAGAVTKDDGAQYPLFLAIAAR